MTITDLLDHTVKWPRVRSTIAASASGAEILTVISRKFSDAVATLNHVSVTYTEVGHVHPITRQTVIKCEGLCPVSPLFP
jgi:hypothetical protein